MPGTFARPYHSRTSNPHAPAIVKSREITPVLRGHQAAAWAEPWAPTLRNGRLRGYADPAAAFSACSLPEARASGLQEPLDEICRALSDVLEPRALLEAREGDLLRVTEIVEEDLIHLPADLRIEHHQRRLVVQRQ